jgi:hypothetical protein
MSIAEILHLSRELPRTHQRPSLARHWHPTGDGAKRKSPADRKMKVMTTSNHCPLDPRKCNIAVDANALDRDGTARDRLVDRFNELSSGRRIRAVVAEGCDPRFSIRGHQSM